MEYKLIIAVIVIGIAIVGLQRFIKRRKGAEVVFYMDRKEFDKCYELMDKGMFRSFMSSFEYISLRMNVAAAAGDDDKMKLCVEKMDVAIMNKPKREKLLSMAMMYYVDKSDRTMCTEILEQLKKINSGLAYQECDRMYHAFVLKDGEYIDEMEKEYADAVDTEKKKSLLSYLVVQYENIGNIKKKNEYQKLLEELVKEG